MTGAFCSFFWETLHIPVLTIQREFMFSSVTAVLKEGLMRVIHCTVELYFVVITIALILALISSIGASPFYIHYIHTFFCISMKYNKNMWSSS
jgi:hypothetical protein